jgi:hypothetical protein
MNAVKSDNSKIWNNDVENGGNKYLFFVSVSKKGDLSLLFYNKLCTNQNKLDQKFLTNEGLLQRLFNLEIIKKNTIYDMNDIKLIDTIFSHKDTTMEISNFNLVIREYNIDTSLSLKEFILNNENKKEKLSILFDQYIINDMISASDSTIDRWTMGKFSVYITCAVKSPSKNIIDTKADIYSSPNIDDDSIHMVKIYL